MGNRLALILGGARSGKSKYAQQLAAESGKPVLFVATAEAGDDEMKERIAAHRLSRPQGWETLEAPRQVGRAILERNPSGLVLVDCLTLLASNVLGQFSEPYKRQEYEVALDEEIEGLLEAYRQTRAEWLVISNEVGMGVVPATPAGRLYRDALGRANQRVALAADEVVLMVAGIAMKVKG
ncbi:MAG: bifunctional adenosylcobinamide kinase/adenosylcobinamide-phosphate guanylyltransferase [Chloroflexi bacterium RBG_16_54_18]|nr:MAG: bifunctional adenosylcobinamide kinase/adenosylcobinamide-phosphate guanylyltransferase [Chloroflexi bacterium RBG_16_54_18]